MNVVIAPVVVALNSLVSEIPVWLWVVFFVVVNTIVNSLGIQFTAKFNIGMLIAELIVHFRRDRDPDLFLDAEHHS